MEKQATVMIAAKLEEAMTKLDDVVECIRENVDPKERAPLLKAIGEIFAIATGEIKSRLAIANPELHELLFRELPKSAPQNFLRMSQSRGTDNREE